MRRLAITLVMGAAALAAAMSYGQTTSRIRGTNHELTLQFGGGEQKVVVPHGVPIVRTVPGTRSDLVPGEYVFVSAQTGSDGVLTARAAAAVRRRSAAASSVG